MAREIRQLRDQLQAQEVEISGLKSDNNQLSDSIERIKTDMLVASGKHKALLSVVASIESASNPSNSSGSTPTLGVGQSMEYLYFSRENSPEGDISIKGPFNWDTSKMLIKEITIETTSVNWELWLVHNGNGKAADTAVVKAIQIMDSGNGSESILIDRPYEDEDDSNNLHLYFNDKAGTAIFTVSVVATELA